MLPIDENDNYTFVMARWQIVVRKSEATKQIKDQNNNKTKNNNNNSNNKDSGGGVGGVGGGVEKQITN